jgi:tetratricopeptide (TPR) repeat protein
MPGVQASSSGAQASTGLDLRLRTICIKALQQLRAGFSQALLYAQDTKQYEKSAEATFEFLSVAVNELGAFHISISRSEAIINGQRLETPLAIRSSIDQVDRFIYNAGLSSIKFEKGLTLPEIASFMQLLSRKKFTSTEGAAINRQLRETGITHIQVGELRYVGLSEGERIVSKDKALDHSGVQNTLSDMAEEFHATMQQIKDVDARMQLQVEMAGQLIEKDATMLNSVLMVGAERLKGLESSDQLVALAALPQRDGELLNSILKIAQTLLGKGIPETDPLFVSLKEFIDRLVDPYRTRAEDILSQLELSELAFKLMPEWLVHACSSLKGGSAETRLDGILVQSPNALLDERMFPQILDVLDELSVARMDPEAERLTTHVAGAMKAITKAGRVKAVERLSTLLERSMEQTSNAVKIIEDALLDACLHETCDEVMKLLLEHLGKRCIHHYKLENYERALEHFDWIVSLEQSSRSALRDEGANLARKTRDAIGTSEFAAGLHKDLLAPDPKGKTAQRMVKALGSALWAKVVDGIRTAPDEKSAEALTVFVAGFGKEAHELYFKALGAEQDPAIAMRLLSLAEKVSKDALLWKPAFNLVRHADPALRTKAIETVIKLDAASSFRSLLEICREVDDHDLRSAIMNNFSRMQDPGILTLMLSALDSALTATDYSENQVVMLLESLSNFENEDLVPPVAALLNPPRRSLVSTDSRASSKPVTIAAIKALTRVYENAVAHEALDRARNHKDPEIARLALATLRGLAKQHANESGAAHDSVEKKNIPQAAKSGGSHTSVRTRRGFEELQSEAEIGQIFQKGAGIGGGTPPARASGLTRAVPKPASEPDPAMKPMLEGQLQDLGLENTVRMVGGRDGVLIIQDQTGESRIAIRAKKIISTVCDGKTGIEALVKTSQIEQARFAYFTTLPMPAANMEVDIKEIQIAIRQFFREGNASDAANFY